MYIENKLNYNNTILKTNIINGNATFWSEMRFSHLTTRKINVILRGVLLIAFLLTTKIPDTNFGPFIPFIHKMVRM